MNERSFNITYEFTGEYNEVEKAAVAIHTALRGNQDYIDCHIVCHYNNNYISVTIWPMHCNRPIPEFLRSNSDFIIFVTDVLKEKADE